MNIEEDFLKCYNDKELENIPMFIANHEKLYDLICEKYNGIHNICRELDLKPPFARNRPKEEVIQELVRLNNKFGYVSKPLMGKYSYINQKVIRRVFGTFANMYEELGIKRHPSGRIPTNEELLSEFKRIYDLYGYIDQDIIEKEAEYSTTCYKDRFGSINNVRKIFRIPTVVPGECQCAAYVISKYETYLNEKAEKEKTFSWLKNPRTNQNLRIDAYFPKHNIALEYNGPQHYQIDARYTKSQDELDYRQYLDKLKITILAKHGIPTIVVHFKDKVTEDYIKESIDITI